MANMAVRLCAQPRGAAIGPGIFQASSHGGVISLQCPVHTCHYGFSVSESVGASVCARLARTAASLVKLRAYPRPAPTVATVRTVGVVSRLPDGALHNCRDLSVWAPGLALPCEASKEADR
jgi:hypothetical protein